MAQFDPQAIPRTTSVVVTAVGIGGIERPITVTAEWSDRSYFISPTPLPVAVAGVLSLEVTLDGEPAYSATVEVLVDGRAVSQSMGYTDRSRFAGMGMPEASLLVARRVLNVPIYSSSNDQKERWLESESVQEEAIKVWKRLAPHGARPPEPGSQRYVLP